MKLLLSLIFITLLSACANHMPTHIALSPELTEIKQHTLSSQNVAIKMLDTRKANFIVRFNQGDDAAKLVSPAESPRKQLDALFRSGFTQAGYQVDPSVPQLLEFQLEYLLTDITESTFGFEAKTQIVINVDAKNSTKRLTKRYSAKGKLKGPFSADYATLELEINKLISALTTEIINDVELHQFIQS